MLANPPIFNFSKNGKILGNQTIFLTPSIPIATLPNNLLFTYEATVYMARDTAAFGTYDVKEIVHKNNAGAIASVLELFDRKSGTLTETTLDISLFPDPNKVAPAIVNLFAGDIFFTYSGKLTITEIEALPLP